MLYSHFLLSKNGPLGTVWVAAHCLKRLKKDQVKQADISSSVDTILQDAVQEFTYRIIAYLLLGVARIFSKKVEFLYNDCYNARDSLKNLAGIKVAGKSSEANHSSTPSISLPKRFELDAFDLEVVEDEDISSHHEVAREEIMLLDTWKEGIDCTNKKRHCGRDLSFEAYCSIYTPVRDVLSPHSMDIDWGGTSSRFISNFESGMEKFRGLQFSLEDRLEPLLIDDEDDFGFGMPYNEGNGSNEQPDAGKAAEQLKLLHEMQSEREFGTNGPSIDGHESDGYQLMNPDVGEPTELVDWPDKEHSIDKLLQAPSLLEKTLGPMCLSDVSKEYTLHLPSSFECLKDGDQTKCSGTGVSSNSPEMVRSLDRELNVDSEEMTLPEASPLHNQITAKHPISITVDPSPDSKSQGAISAVLMAVRTPSVKERARIKKRKCLFDETAVLPNDVLKHWIDNSNYLVCKRRKAPLTAFQSWQAQKISNLPKSFLEPSFPCNAVAFKSVVSRLSQKDFRTQEPVEPVEVHLTEIITKTPVNQVVVESPIKERSREGTPIAPATPTAHPTSLREETPIAPATPITHSTSWRLNEDQGVSKPDRLDHASSSGSMERLLAPNEDPDFVTGLMDEEIASSTGDTHEKQKCSMRTRKVAKYLHAKLQHQRKQNGGTFVNLTDVFKGKMRKESARLFYEILVLKTGDYIDVEQERGFGDILVMGSPKLKDVIVADGVTSRA